MTEKQTEIQLELLTEENLSFVRQIDRSDVPIAYVDDVATLWELTQYGTEHQLAGCTFAVKHEGQYVGALLLGEALPWETDPEEMKQLLAKLDRENKGLRYRIFGAIQRGEIDGFKPISKMQGYKAYEENEE